MGLFNKGSTKQANPAPKPKAKNTMKPADLSGELLLR